MVSLSYLIKLPKNNQIILRTYFLHLSNVFKTLHFNFMVFPKIKKWTDQKILFILINQFNLFSKLFSFVRN